MMIVAYVTAGLKQALINHLWQTTAVGLLAWALALCFRSNHARLRYRIWMAASVKFLIPFSLLIAAGHAIHPSSTGITPMHPMETMVARSVQPYTPGLPPAMTAAEREAAAPNRGNRLFAMCIMVWVVGALFVIGSWLRTSSSLRLLARRARPWGARDGVPVLKTDGLLEPGVLGIVRPVILMPSELLQRLSDAEIETIFAHELSHVRRRDNLTAALHTLVVALFWFHPLTWVIRARLFDERERACDESVLASGNDAEVYARSLLDVCRFCVEAPAESMAGVTGGELKERVLRITSERLYKRLGTNGKLLLAMFIVGVLSLPFAAGFIDAREVYAQAVSVSSGSDPAPQYPEMNAPRPSFEVVSIRPANDVRGMSWDGGSDYVKINGAPMKLLVWAAFDLKNFQVQNAPAWLDSEHYTINAKLPPGMEKLSQQQVAKQQGLMLQSMLIDRFHLRYHWVTKEVSVFSLETGKGGAKVQAAAPDEKYGMMIGNDTYDMHSVPMSEFANNLGANLDKIVIDKTGLTGKYTFTLRYPPAPDAPPDSPTESEARLLTALQDQLGLRLVAEKSPVKILVIDNIERPTAN